MNGSDAEFLVGQQLPPLLRTDPDRLLLLCYPDLAERVLVIAALIPPRLVIVMDDLLVFYLFLGFLFLLHLHTLLFFLLLLRFRLLLLCLWFFYRI